MGFLKSIIDIVLTPINLLVDGLFPNMSNAISSFNTMLNSYVGNSLSWFFSFVPPITKSILLIALTFLIGYYTFIWSYSLIIKLWNVIQKIKLW